MAGRAATPGLPAPAIDGDIAAHCVARAVPRILPWLPAVAGLPLPGNRLQKMPRTVVLADILSPRCRIRQETPCFVIPGRQPGFLDYVTSILTQPGDTLNGYRISPSSRFAQDPHCLRRHLPQSLWHQPCGGSLPALGSCRSPSASTGHPARYRLTGSLRYSTRTLNEIPRRLPQ